MVSLRTLYIDDYALVDVTYLKAAFVFDGRQEDDGLYCINGILIIDEVAERVSFVYPTATERNAAFREIGRMARALEADRAPWEDTDAEQ